jgi:Family of unknown function (DUF7033)
MNEINKTLRYAQEARRYAIRELARRAGVTADFYRTWKVDIGPEETVIYIQPGTRKHIHFKHVSEQFWEELDKGILRTARASWMHTPAEPLKTLVPDFVVPFAEASQSGLSPLFNQVDEECVECPLDLPLSTLLTLSRYEEMLPGERDVHGRFPASMSIAVRHDFLHRPVVDEYGLALEQALAYLLPGWRPTERKLRVKLSHDIDDVGMPFRFRSALKHTVRCGKPFSTARDLFSQVSDTEPTALELVRRTARMSLRRKLDSAVYWKASIKTQWDNGYDPRHPKVREVVQWLDDHGVETGVHPSYVSYLAPEQLLEEVQILQEVLGNKPLGGRQHYLRWCPETWRHWETCGLAYDSTVGFADRVGFRAGTCLPYHPWLLRLNREAHLAEIPLIVMDKTLIRYMGLTPQKSLETVRGCVTRCRAVGGVFTLLWHNTSFDKSAYRNVYLKTLDQIAASEAFNWKSGSNGFC